MVLDSKKIPHISVVIPVYGARDCLDSLHERLVSTLEKITPDFEIIMVNDASPDGSWDSILDLNGLDKRVKGIDFSRNFGQHYALSAGLHHAQGDWVVVMDCDLQDPPEEISKLYAKAQEGFDVVFGERANRQDKFLKKLGSRAFWIVFDYLTDQRSDPTIANFSIISRNVVVSYCEFSEQSSFYPLFIRWLGFKSTQIPVQHGHRDIGETSYSFRKKMDLALQGIISFSNKPLKLSIKLGFSIAFFSTLFAGKLFVDYLFFAKPVAGWTSVMVSIYFLSGMLMANMGLLGLYIGKVFDETKGRPLYVIGDRVGFTKE